MNCMIEAYSNATGVPAAKLIELLGHDGEEITCPILPEPFCRKGFTTSEFNAVLYPLGFTFTELMADYTDVSMYTNYADHNYIAYNTRHCENYKFRGPCTLRDLKGIILVDDSKIYLHNL